MSARYGASEHLLKEAMELFPTGAQTAMKTTVSFPAGIAPHFVCRAEAARLWDIDGNEYIDFVGALGAITLGYGDPDILVAVRQTLENGPLFSLSHPLELEVARLLVEMIPCAEMVRFGKNGSDMTTTAVRLARAVTGRDRIALCGYHGWHDWSIARTPLHAGIPEAVRTLTDTFHYNDIDSLEQLFRQHDRQIATVIMEPMRMEPPQNGFLEAVRDLATVNGAILIFDEIVTGFRLANGGAQELFGVIPDLAVFAKGLANGFPLSALVGRRDVMRHLARVHASLTYGGETLSLAAAKATLEKYRRLPVIITLKRLGARLLDASRTLVTRNELEEVFAVGGDPAWPFLLPHEGLGFSEIEIRTFFLQEMFRRGFLVLGAHALSFAQTENDIDLLNAAYAEVLPRLAAAIRTRTLPSLLETVPPDRSPTRWR